MADQQSGRVHRIDCDPWLDCGARINYAAEGGLLLVHIVLSAGSERIGAGHLHERAESLSLGRLTRTRLRRLMRRGCHWRAGARKNAWCDSSSCSPWVPSLSMCRLNLMASLVPPSLKFVRALMMGAGSAATPRYRPIGPAFATSGAARDGPGLRVHEECEQQKPRMSNTKLSYIRRQPSPVTPLLRRYCENVPCDTLAQLRRLCCGAPHRKGRRRSRLMLSYALSRRPLSRAYRPFVGPILKGGNGYGLARSPRCCRMTPICAFLPSHRDRRRAGLRHSGRRP